MMVMPEDCLTFDVIAAEGQTVKLVSAQAVWGEAWSVDWGDGSSDSVNQSGNVTFTHTYSAGFYRIKFRAGAGGALRLHLSNSTANICACNEAWHHHPSMMGFGLEKAANSTLILNTLPPSLTALDWAFRDSPKIRLNFSQFPASLQNISGAFSYCSAALLPFKGLPSTLVNEGFGTFHSCTNAVSVIDSLPEGFTDMGAMFHRCSKMTISFSKLPDAVTSLYSCFWGCTGLTCDLDELASNAPEGGYASLKGIGDAFYNCPGVTGSRSAFLAACPNVTNTTNAFNGTNTTE